MRSWPLALALLIVLPASGVAQAPATASFEVGVAIRHVLPPEPYDWRAPPPILFLKSYGIRPESPANAKPQLIPPVGPAIFHAAAAAPEAPMAASPGKFPLILLSHGTGGTAPIGGVVRNRARRARLYRRRREPSRATTAIEPHTVQGFSLWWLRANDLSAVLNDILTDPKIGPRIDHARIGAAGFSLGGYTMFEACRRQKPR